MPEQSTQNSRTDWLVLICTDGVSITNDLKEIQVAMDAGWFWESNCLKNDSLMLCRKLFLNDSSLGRLHARQINLVFARLTVKSEIP